MSFPVKGKSAIITGAGSGINFSFAKLLLENGCNVLIADLSLRQEARNIVDKYSREAFRPRAIFQKTDVTDWIQLERMFETAEKEFGEIDIVCPGAGVFEPHWSNFWLPPGSPQSRDSSTGGRYALIDINLTHPIRSTQLAISYFLRHLASKKPRHIIHISSIAGQVPVFVAPIYAATKHGINALVRSMAPLDKQFGIRVTAVAPGVIKTPLWTEHPEKLKMVNDADDAWVTPEEVAQVMLALIQQDKVSEIIGGHGGQGRHFAIQGGTILEVLKTVRAVTPYDDPGPEGKPGSTASDTGLVVSETIELLSQEAWGKTSEGH